MRWLSLTLSVITGSAAVFFQSPVVNRWISLYTRFDANDDWNILYHQGGNSPWIPKVDGILDGGIDVPPNCVVDQIHMMSRHGERYPTVTPGIRMLELYRRVSQANMTFLDDLAFVNDWDFTFAPYPQQQFEQLITTGKYAGSLQAFAAGVKLRTRYLPLLEQALSAARPLSFWTTDSRRVIESARYFASGFIGLDWNESATLHVMPKGLHRGAEVLSPGRSCPNYMNNLDGRGHPYGAQKLMAFQASYLPDISRRLRIENPEINFTTLEIFTMQELCGFETLALGRSDWCNVFTHQEIESFEYARDLLHYYRAGPGNLYGATMGWLWLNATTELLRQGPDAGPVCLSLYGLPDNHDGDIVAFLAALNLFPQTPDLPTEHVLHNRTWATSDVVPMGGRIILERFVCPAPQHCWDNGPLYPNHVYCDPLRNDTFVRVNVNDGIVRIHDCDDGPGKSCPLEAFVERTKKLGERAGDFAEVCNLPPEVPQRLTFLHQ